MQTTCPQCGREKKDWARLCWKCYQAEQLKQQYRLGHLDGYNKGLRDGRVQAEAERRGNGALASALGPERVRQLIQLCHPDHHGNSPTANAITQWLLTLR